MTRTALVSSLDDTVRIRAWIREGGMLVNTSALNHDHPDHPYNQIVAMGKRPEDYGISHPLAEEFQGKSRADLIQEIVNLRNEVGAWVRADAMGMIGNRNAR